MTLNPIQPRKDINAMGVRAFSLIGIVIHLLLFSFAFAMGHLSDGPAPNPVDTLAAPIISTPFLYFIFCYVTSYPRWRGKGLFITGIIIHLLVLYPYYLLLQSGNGLLLAVPVFLAPCWFMTWKSRLKEHAG
jgi:hypothetical protein